MEETLISFEKGQRQTRDSKGLAENIPQRLTVALDGLFVASGFRLHLGNEPP
jgi:hypothetical protein